MEEGSTNNDNSMQIYLQDPEFQETYTLTVAIMMPGELNMISITFG